MSDSDSIITRVVEAEINVIVGVSDGILKLPEGGVKGYWRGLWSTSSAKPRLEVLALRDTYGGTEIHVYVKNEDGVKPAGHFHIKKHVTIDNAVATGESIAKLLGSPQCIEECQTRLLGLVRGGEGTGLAFIRAIGEEGPLQIENRS